MTSGHYCWFRMEFFITGLQDIHGWPGQTATLTVQVGHVALSVLTAPHVDLRDWHWKLCVQHT